jgi:hypothetical protein
VQQAKNVFTFFTAYPLAVLQEIDTVQTLHTDLCNPHSDNDNVIVTAINSSSSSNTNMNSSIDTGVPFD